MSCCWDCICTTTSGVTKVVCLPVQLLKLLIIVCIVLAVYVAYPYVLALVALVHKYGPP